MPGQARSRIVSVLVISFLLTATSLTGNAQIRFDLPTQPLAQALTAVGSLTNLNIYFDAATVDGIQAPALKAQLNADDALAKLLAGTRLHAVRVDENTVRVVSGSESKHAQTTREPVTGTARPPPPVHLASADLASQTAVRSEAATSEADDTVGGRSSSRREIDEVVVTAQKREERLIDTPQSVSVLTSTDLAELGATQFRDFANTVPGLSFSTAGAGNSQVTLRGVTVGFDISPTVGIYVDEVPYGSSTVFNLGAQFALDTALFDLNRIEVLRGPQGTLYGASAMGGLIKYVTQRPDTTHFGGDAQVGVSSTGDGGGINYVAAAAVNLPVAPDRAALRVSGYESHDGGFIDNVASNQKDVNRSNVYGGRLDFLLTPVEALSIRLTAFAQNIARNGEGTADYTFAATKPYGTYGQYRKFEEPFHQQFRLGSATVVYDFGPMSLTSISAYQTSRLTTFWDISSAYVPYGLCACSAIGLPNDGRTDKFTEEVRLASNGEHRLQWVVGGFYNHESSRTSEEFVLRDLSGNPLPNNLYTYYVPSTFEEYAAFGDLTLHITSKFDVTGGLRDAHNSQRFAQSGSGLLGNSAPNTTSSESVVTYLGDARYHFTPHATAYLRYATGYRPGGPNIVTAAGGPRSFDSDTLRSYEMGIKAETDDRRFGFDVDGYIIHWDNIQIGVIRGGFQTYTNAPGGATIQGSELTFTARPLSELLMTAGMAYQHAYMNQAQPGLGASQGERLPNVPRFTADVNADYVLSNGALQPSVGATVRYVGERNASFDGSLTYPQYHLPQYTMLDLRTQLTFGRFDTQFYVHNVLDDHSQLSIIFPQFGARVAVAQPRTIGVNVSTKF